MPLDHASECSVVVRHHFTPLPYPPNSDTTPLQVLGRDGFERARRGTRGGGGGGGCEEARKGHGRRRGGQIRGHRDDGGRVRKGTVVGVSHVHLTGALEIHRGRTHWILGGGQSCRQTHIVYGDVFAEDKEYKHVNILLLAVYGV